MGDMTQATRQEEMGWAADQGAEWASLEEAAIEPIRGFPLAKLSPHGNQYDLGLRGPLAERQLPLFVIVRTPGHHDLFHIEATTTRARVAGPRSLPAAKLALATMRSAFARMGQVTA
jgi:hypothetical protein